MGNMEKREQGHAGDISECLGENNHFVAFDSGGQELRQISNICRWILRKSENLRYQLLLLHIYSENINLNIFSVCSLMPVQGVEGSKHYGTLSVNKRVWKVFLFFVSVLFKSFFFSSLLSLRKRHEAGQKKD